MSVLSPFARDAYGIYSPRLIIRTAIESDAEDIREFITNPDNHPHSQTESDVTIESMRTRIGKWQDSTAKGIGGLQVITLRSTGEFIGYGGFNRFDLIDGPVENATPRYLADIGIMIAKSHWRKGYGTEALSALTEYAFAELGIVRVRIETDLTNEPWRRLMHTLGLAQFEKQQRVTYDDKAVGYTWYFDAADWQVIKEDMKGKGKWSL
ncbi:acetyltransferase [Xylaria acuta]|nr:acetyltransferase [Xylaria acuta]